MITGLIKGHTGAIVADQDTTAFGHPKGVLIEVGKEDLIDLRATNVLVIVIAVIAGKEVETTYPTQVVAM